MKRSILLVGVLLLICGFSACEKEMLMDSGIVKKGGNSLNNLKNEKEYIFYNAKWELINKAHKDEFGATGELYINLNNKTEMMFCIDGGSNGDMTKPTGTYTEKVDKNNNKIQTCTGDPYDCGFRFVTKEATGEIVSAEIRVYKSETL